MAQPGYTILLDDYDDFENTTSYVVEIEHAPFMQQLFEAMTTFQNLFIIGSSMQRQVAQVKCAIELAADISVFIRKVGEQLSLLENYFRADSAEYRHISQEIDSVTRQFSAKWNELRKATDSLLHATALEDL
jgi:hypothetical protein